MKKFYILSSLLLFFMFLLFIDYSFFLRTLETPLLNIFMNIYYRQGGRVIFLIFVVVVRRKKILGFAIFISEYNVISFELNTLMFKYFSFLLMIYVVFLSVCFIFNFRSSILNCVAGKFRLRGIMDLSGRVV